MFEYAILGGTFDPVHKGHLFLIHTVYENTGCNNIIVVPDHQSNFKRSELPHSSDCDRLDMLKIALFEDYKVLYPNDKINFILSDCEIKRGGISYTYDTVISLKKSLGISEKVGLLIGDDHVLRLSEWYNFSSLKKEVTFVVCRRLEEPVWDKIPSNLDYIKIENSTSPESATLVRNSISSNSSYLTKGVLDYVTKKNLYC